MAEIQHAEKVFEGSNSEDHDLLITLHEQVKFVRDDIRDLKDGISTKLQDHELRLRRLELWYAVALGISYALTFYFNYLKR